MPPAPAPVYMGTAGLASPMEAERHTQIQRTKTGLLLLLIGTLIRWIPLIGLVGGLLALVGAMIFGADALGFGDVKLVAFIGSVVGIYKVAIVSALFLGVLFAGVVSLLLVVTRIRSMKDAIPYGPFLAAGALVVLWQLGAQ